MQQGRRETTNRQRAAGILLVFLGALQLIVGVVAPRSAAAADAGPGTLLGFEADGNQTVDVAVPPGNLDWSNVTRTVLTDGTSPDFGYQGASKENDPSAFICQAKDGAITPGKANLIRAYVHNDITPTKARLALGFVREDDGGQGDSHVNFEFNQGTITFNPVANGACPYTGRMAGDLLFTFDFPGNSTSPAVIKVYRWNPAISADGQWDELTIGNVSALVVASDNTAQITDQVVGGVLPIRTFGEVVVDLLELDRQVDGNPLLSCPGFGSATVRSRASGESFEAALQDFIEPVGIDLSTCGSVKIRKVDDLGQPMAGIGFGIFANDQGTGAPIDTCITNDAGICVFDDVPPTGEGPSYSIFEDASTVPAGYSPATNPVKTGITVGFKQNVDLTATPIVNPRQTGWVEVTKALAELTGEPVVPGDLDVLAGTAFLVYDDDVPDGGNGNGDYDAGEEVTRWGTTDPAGCTVAVGEDACLIGPVATGDYRITETVVPDGTTKGDDIPVTITSADTQQVPVEVTYTNLLSPLEITLDKSGPATATVGDTFEYTFDVTTDGPPLGNVFVTELTAARCDTDLAGPAKTGGDTDDLLEVGETWTYTCDHTVTFDDPDPLPNEAQASGTDAFGRTVTDNDTHLVDLIDPDVVVEKSAVDDVLDAGDAIAFDLTVSNLGPAVAKGVTLTDTLPRGTDGLVWRLDPVVSGCAIADGTLTCQLGDLEPRSSVEIHVVATSRISDCGLLPNQAVADSSNGPVVESNVATVLVLCPLDITVEKAGPDLAHVGDEITYTIVVTNSGEADLVDVVLTDPVCDDDSVELFDDADGDSTLAVDEVWIYSCTHVVTADDPDPLPNTATAVGTDERERTTEDDDDHVVDLIAPAIQIVKSVDDDGPNPGDTISFTYVVTNTGDTALLDVVVVDDQLGEIGTIPALDPGESVTLTKDDVVQSDQDLVNVATSTGRDILGKEVSDDDSVTISIVIPDVVVRRPPARLPVTGASLGLLVLVAGMCLLCGFSASRIAHHLRRRGGAHLH